MSDLIEKCMQTATFINIPSYEDYVQTDIQVREMAMSYISKI